MAKTYRIDMRHVFIVKTDDIQEVMRTYFFPDFSDCESIVGEPEFYEGTNTWEEIPETGEETNV